MATRLPSMCARVVGCASHHASSSLSRAAASAHMCVGTHTRTHTPASSLAALRQSRTPSCAHSLGTTIRGFVSSAGQRASGAVPAASRAGAQAHTHTHTHTCERSFSTVISREEEAERGGSVAGSEASDDPMAALATPAVWRGMKRFYSHVDVREVTHTHTHTHPHTHTGTHTQAGASEGPVVHAKLAAAYPGTRLYQVLIQGRPLRTNMANDLLLPSHALALAIAGEFARTGAHAHIASAHTPLYTLASTAIDSYVHENEEEANDADAAERAQRVYALQRAMGAHADAGAPAQSEVDMSGKAPTGAMGGRAQGSVGTSKLRDLMIDFLETDTVCFRIDPDLADPSERLLRRRQEKVYGPLLRWWKDSFGEHAVLDVVEGFAEPRHPDSAFMVAEDAVDIANPFLKAALHTAVSSTKSAVIALALVHGHLDADDAFEAARLEEEWQIEENGFVEDGHDTPRAALRTSITAVNAFIRMLSPGAAPPAVPNPRLKSYAATLANTIKAREERVQARRERERDLMNVHLERLRAADAPKRRAVAGPAAGASSS